jgi:outer membrane protein OmpA-like peptidoglycan-associated protein
MRIKYLLFGMMMLCSVGVRAQDDNNAHAQLNAADEKIAELRAKIAEMKEQSRPILPITILFSAGKAVIDNTQTTALGMIAGYIKKNPGIKILIKGYTSTEKKDMINPDLSGLRANTIKNELIDKYGVDASALEAKGMGATDKLYGELEFNRVVTFSDMSK